MPGLFHCGSPVDATWWDLAQESVRLYGLQTKIRQITTEEYPLPAKRPGDTRTSSDKLLGAYGVGVSDWHEALANVVAELPQRS